MIPAFDSRGLLPPGVHSCTLQQAKDVFAFNPRRAQLFESLGNCLQLMHANGLQGSVLLDGSYVTDKEHPGDIEVVLDARTKNRAAEDKALVFFVRFHADLAETGVDWYPTVKHGNNDFTLFFQYAGEKTAVQKRCQPKDLKGILRLTKW